MLPVSQVVSTSLTSISYVLRNWWSRLSFNFSILRCTKNLISLKGFQDSLKNSEDSPSIKRCLSSIFGLLRSSLWYCHWSKSLRWMIYRTQYGCSTDTSSKRSWSSLWASLCSWAGIWALNSKISSSDISDSRKMIRSSTSDFSGSSRQLS